MTHRDEKSPLTVQMYDEFMPQFPPRSLATTGGSRKPLPIRCGHLFRPRRGEILEPGLNRRRRLRDAVGGPGFSSREYEVFELQAKFEAGERWHLHIRKGQAYIHAGAARQWNIS